MIRQIINQLNEWTNAYNAGNPIVSDSEWDDLYFKLVEKEKETGIIYPDSPTQTIHYEKKTSLDSITHNTPMLSLDKTRDWGEFLSYFSDINPYKDVVGMVKLDGLTWRLTYENGELVMAETRGNGGIEGENVLHNAKVNHTIPQKICYTHRLVIDGELICTYSNFERFADMYKNTRGLAAGSATLLDAKEFENRNLTFVAWNVVEGLYDELIASFEKLSDLGFLVVPWTSSFDWDAKEFLIEDAKEQGYPIDGLVGRFNDLSFGRTLGSTAHHPKSAYAFKFKDDEFETTLQDIEWQMGRTGVLTPVAIFNSVEIDGTSVNRASLHNLSIMRETLGEYPHKNQTVYVAKMNMIIPQIVNAIKDKVYDYELILIPPMFCPCCGELTQTLVSETQTETLVCLNPNCSGRLINKLDNFCSKKNGLNIKGLSGATLEKLLDWGWINSCSDIFSLWKYANEWKRKEGFGEKSVTNILASIEAARHTTLDKFISSLGIPLIGPNVAKVIANHFKTYENFRTAVNTKFDFSTLEGFADSKSIAIFYFDYDDADKIAELLIFEENEEEIKSTLSGMSIAITGKLSMVKNRDELVKMIEASGGKVASSISKNTSLLVNNDAESHSSKNIAAQKLGIPIMTEKEFFENFLKNI